MFYSYILILFVVSVAAPEGKKEIIFQMEMDLLSFNQTVPEISNDSNMLCYLKCKSYADEFTENRSIFLNMINIFSKEELFIINGSLRKSILECMAGNSSTGTCGENYSRCKPFISVSNSKCCLHRSTLNMSNLDWGNFVGFPKETDCLMKCIKARKNIFDEDGEAGALNVFSNMEFVDIMHEKKRTFRRCVLNGSGVHTCREIIHIYICFFRNMKKADPREWLYY